MDLSPNAQPVLVVGPLDPLVRAAFVRGARKAFAVVEAIAPLDVVRRLGTDKELVAIVLRRVDAAESHESARVPWVGLSSVSRDVIVVSRDGVTHLDNPTVEELCEYIREWVR